jgi:hypothetical protein
LVKRALKQKLHIFLALGLLGMALQAQTSVDGPLWQAKIIPAGTDTFSLDSALVWPQSISFLSAAGKKVQPNYTFLGRQPALLIFNPALADTVKVRYQTLALPLFKPYRFKDTSLILPSTQLSEEQLAQNTYSRSQAASFKPFQGLQSQGSISRGVAVGNNQDAVLSSDLNLQLAGNLGDNTTLSASITDNSLPVQANGYTQQLREFDRVYLELQNPSFGLLRAGDYNMESQNNYWLNFQKRISGAGVFTQIKTPKGKIPVQAQGGIARGKFARNRFQGQEGNQGPYRLRGANNENFIVIISGSERVYIDGILQKRGQQYDYVIDYNAGEITFTALQPITKDKRIVVEFQYTEQNYLRSVAYAQTGYQSQNWQTRVQFYSEQDSKNQPLISEYSDAEKRRLSEVGDNLEQAQVPAIEQASFSDVEVLYRLRDSLGFDSVLVFTTDSTGPLYRASFSFVGANRGNYQLSQSAANGRVFTWVAPQAGVPQGSYAPVRRLVAPNQLQVLTLSTQGTWGKDQNLKVDLATSNNDVNLFSEADKANDVGTAGRLQYQGSFPLKRGKLLTKAQLEFNEDRYVTLERVRPVEFARDWNLPFNYSGAVQLAQAGLGYQQDSSRLFYNFEFLEAQGTQGQRQVLALNHRGQKQLGQWRFSWLNSQDTLRNTQFLRQQGNYRYFIDSAWWVGVQSVGEWNLQKLQGLGDSLTNFSYSFLEYRAFTGFGDTAANFVEMGFLQRLDDTARAGTLQRFSVANTYFARAQYKTNFNSRINFRANLRNLSVLQPQENPLERTLTGRASYLQKIFKNAVVSNTFYEVGAGSEPRRSFSYVEVPAGTGTYTHTDYNGNGIKELDEFEIAPTPDLATFIRVFTPNNEFVRTNLLKFGQTLNVNAPFSWQQATGFKKIARKFSLLFNYQIDRKTLLTGNTNQLNPFATVASDTQIVALNNTFRNTLFFNRAQTQFGADVTIRQSDNRTLLSFGVEQRRVQEALANLRFGLGKAFIFRVRGSVADKENNSGNFANRNFAIRAYANRYSLSYQPGNTFTLTGSYAVSSEQSTGDVANLLVSQNLGAELNYNLAQKIALLLEANYIYNGFNGAVNSPAGYEMLQALRPGNNATVNLTLQRTFLKNIVLSLTYGGRYSNTANAIHTGNVSVKAFF